MVCIAERLFYLYRRIMQKKRVPLSEGIVVKKKFGQHFLRNESVVQAIVDRVELDPTSSVFEIGCGDGFLTREILTKDIARLWIFEIDADWVKYITETIHDPRITMHHENILDVDFSSFPPYQPWTLLANLPYQVTFPILYKLQANRHLLKEGVIMVQEEVAQKIVKKSGRGYGFTSLYFQYYFDWQLMQKIAPGSFFPPPKVFSRLMYFKPKTELTPIPDAENFWKFIKHCFLQPRRTMRNNLQQTHYDLSKLSEETLQLRAQQLGFDELLDIWKALQG